MVKRKLDGTVDESSADRKIRKSYVTCEKSGGLHLSEPGLTAGGLSIRQTKFGRGFKF